MLRCGDVGGTLWSRDFGGMLWSGVLVGCYVGLQMYADTFSSNLQVTFSFFFAENLKALFFFIFDGLLKNMK